MFVRLLVETRPEHFEGMREAFRDLTKTTHIFIPVSDARPTDASGRRADEGTHWSLLLVSLIDGVAFHYDSLRSHDGRSTHNMRYAQHAASQISRFVGKPIQMLDLDDTPKQHNGSDCGVFVCMQMRHLLMRRLLSANSRQKISMSMAGKMVDSQGARKEMMKIIDGFIKQGNARRRS
jgi:sentrin-specific protease 8